MRIPVNYRTFVLLESKGLGVSGFGLGLGLGGGSSGMDRGVDTGLGLNPGSIIGLFSGVVFIDTCG